MSTEQLSQGLSHLSEAEHKLLAAQSGQWREIGISAVAAAARQASEKPPEAKVEAGVGQPGKVVTLRDIDHLAA